MDTFFKTEFEPICLSIHLKGKKKTDIAIENEKKVTYCYDIASWWQNLDVKRWYWALPTMLPESPGIEIGKLNRKPEFANTWTICKVGDSFVGNHRQQLYACITPIIEWFIFCVASCCLSTSEPAAQGFPASNTTWWCIICLLCTTIFGTNTYLLRNRQKNFGAPKGNHKFYQNAVLVLVKLCKKMLLWNAKEQVNMYTKLLSVVDSRGPGQG